MATTQLHRTVPQLYRDCLRLVRRVAPGRTSPKATALRAVLRGEFEKPIAAGDSLDGRKASAVRGLSNYMLTLSAPKDPRLEAQAQDFHGRSVQQAQDAQRQRRMDKTNPELGDRQ